MKTQRKPVLQSRIGPKKLFHLVFIAGQNDNHVGVRFRKDGKQGMDDLFSVVVRIMASGVQGISLIDEKHAALGLFEDFSHVLFGLSDIFAYQAGAAGYYRMSAGKQSHVVVHPADQLGHRGLSGSRIAEEQHVVTVFAVLFQAEFLAFLDEERHRPCLFHVLFQPSQAYHLLQLLFGCKLIGVIPFLHVSLPGIFFEEGYGLLIPFRLHRKGVFVGKQPVQQQACRPHRPDTFFCTLENEGRVRKGVACQQGSQHVQQVDGVGSVIQFGNLGHYHAFLADFLNGVFPFQTF